MRSFFRDRSANVDAVRALPRLEHTRAEIQQLARAFGASRSDYVLDVVATESELNRRNADGRLGRAEVIAFATHGLMAGDLAGSLAEPALALTPPTEPSEADDGLLTASEAARLRLNARWVILSACNTAAGGRPDAEGLTGLARAFFYAGARTLLVSQWPINDEAAQRLTTRAVELQRLGNITTAEAMRRSMAELMADRSRDEQGRSFAHPSAWAPFVLVSGE
jgi:CHAT domain-containing protein